MKNILKVIEQYLRKYPNPSQITPFKNYLKLNYTYTNPYTDSKNNKECLYQLDQTQQNNKFLQPEIKKILYRQKGKIEESDSFDGINTKEKHEKVLQDDVFGTAVCSQDLNRWIYIAEIKQEPPKSYYLDGKGKLPYKHDFGETYDDVKEVGIFVWDKQLKKIFRIQLDSNIIPSFPSFANAQGTQIIFHGYKRQHFGHGILHCFNRNVKVYEGKIELIKTMKQNKQQLKLQSKIKFLFEDGERTNIFPSISPCFNYIVYLSGSGITHTYYMDFVILKYKNDSWVQTHRLKNTFVGYYDTLKAYIVQEDNCTFAFAQSLWRGTTNLYKINLETGQFVNLVEQYPNHVFSISEVLPNGNILGKVSHINFNTFFYFKDQQINIIQPFNQEKFICSEFNDPIHGFLVQAPEQSILEQYRQRVNNRPLVVLVHGGPHGNAQPTLTLLRYLLLKLGYALLIPNFSGSAGYGSQLLSNALQSIGEKDTDEIVKLLQNVLKAKPTIDKSKVHVHGGSYGGYLGGILGSRYSSYFNSAVIMNGVLSIIANLWTTDIPEWNTVETLGIDKLSELSEQHYINMFRQSPTSQPMKIPTLQFLGAKDRRVPYKQGLLFDAITKDFGTAITTYVYENSAHGLADSVETTIDIIIKTIIFMEGIKEQDNKQQNNQK